MLLHFGHLFLAHCSAQQIGLTQGVTSKILGNSHDLLLVDHDSVGLTEDRFKSGVGEVDRLASVFAVDELGNQPCIQWTGTVKSKDRGNVLQG